MFNKDLHEGASGDLMNWHAAHPGYTVDQLAADGLDTGIAVPDYVQWAPAEFGHLTRANTRTGRRYVGYNHESRAIYQSVADAGDLAQVVRVNARRLSISPRMARSNIVHIATIFFRCGLLAPYGRRTD
jgi:hypothetical protein